MSPLLPPFLRQLFNIKWQGEDKRVFSLTDQLTSTLKEIAWRQNRPEEDVFDDVIEAGLLQVIGRNDGKLGDAWDSLTLIQQRITCLLCLGLTSYEIASTLNVSYDTIRYHSKQIYRAFGLKRKELRRALKGWKFDEWWEHQQL
jgi:DNA-binding CsgD family transcriptional regulator